MRWALLLVCACGRVGFDPLVRAGDAAPADLDAPEDAAGTDLVAYFPFDSDFDDAEGGAAFCTQPACPAFTTGSHLGMALHFDGNDDCLTVPNAGQFDLANVTIAIWANANGPLALRQTQASLRVDVSGMPENSWQLETTGVGSGDQQSFTTDHGAANDQLTADHVIEPNVWQHLVGTYDGTTKSLYVDGVLVSSAPIGLPLAYDGHPVEVGCDDNGGPSEFYTGSLDELRIYRRALTAAEVQALP